MTLAPNPGLLHDGRTTDQKDTMSALDYNRHIRRPLATELLDAIPLLTDPDHPGWDTWEAVHGPQGGVTMPPESLQRVQTASADGADPEELLNIAALEGISVGTQLALDAGGVVLHHLLTWLQHNHGHEAHANALDYVRTQISELP